MVRGDDQHIYERAEAEQMMMHKDLMILEKGNCLQDDCVTVTESEFEKKKCTNALTINHAIWYVVFHQRTYRWSQMFWSTSNATSIKSNDEPHSLAVISFFEHGETSKQKLVLQIVRTTYSLNWLVFRISWMKLLWKMFQALTENQKKTVRLLNKYFELHDTITRDWDVKAGNCES